MQQHAGIKISTVKYIQLRAASRRAIFKQKYYGKIYLHMSQHHTWSKNLHNSNLPGTSKCCPLVENTERCSLIPLISTSSGSEGQSTPVEIQEDKYLFICLLFIFLEHSHEVCCWPTDDTPESLGALLALPFPRRQIPNANTTDGPSPETEDENLTGQTVHFGSSSFIKKWKLLSFGLF